MKRVGLLTDIQFAVAERIRALDVISGPPAIEVLEEDKGDLDSQIERAKGKLGIVVSVETPQMRRGEQKRHVEMTVVVEVQEMVSINRGPAGTKRTWLQVAEEIMVSLHGWKPAESLQPLAFQDMGSTGPGSPVVCPITFTTGMFI
jgi:hypothetical protein